MLSSDPHATCPSAATSNPTKFFALTCPAKVRTHASRSVAEVLGLRLSVIPRFTSHSFRVLSVEAVTILSPPIHRTYDAARLCPESVTRGLDACRTSYTYAPQSADATATTLAFSGENCTEHTFALI